ncbi:hypothetical protein ABZW96_09010 [Nocardia sp. NPDC004168]|uniref:hypothetical protein n=1 Tax=unclassified Nocardia TaxID=2637762 RepID=UPI0033BB70EA
MIDRGRVAALPTGHEAARIADSGRAAASYPGRGRPLPVTAPPAALLVGERGDRLVSTGSAPGHRITP